VRGKVALITGTSGGMGRAAAELFAEAGATVVGCDTRPARGEAQVDLTDEDDVRRWVDEAAEEHGGIDVLYANAGAARPRGPA
jgi:meso-butanediol dehydrogenase / (S,S)-butanediol dehydrogenase / diacetyl reductase